MSTIKVDTIQDTSGNEMFTAKAWVNFNGTGTVAIRADGNVSSLTDRGVGQYTVTFQNSFSDVNYAATATRSGSSSGSYVAGGDATAAPTTSTFPPGIVYPGVNYYDDSIVAVDVNR